MIRRRYVFKNDFGEAPERPPLEKKSLLQYVLEEGNIFAPDSPSIEKGEGCVFFKIGGVRFKASLTSLRVWGGIITPQQRLLRTTPGELKSLGVDWEELEKLLLPPTNSPQIPSKKTKKISLDFIASEEEAKKILSYIRKRGKVLFYHENYYKEEKE